MSELMTFFEALEKAKDRDKVQAENGEGLHWVTKGKTDLHETVFPVGFLMEKVWQVQKAEQKVLTTTDYMDLASSDPGKLRNRDIAQAFIQGKENGRLERDLEYRDLISKLERHLDEDLAENCYSYLRWAFKNLKPL